MRTPLAVNPDGAAASYLPGDHGFTYIANGVSLRVNGVWIGCKGEAASRRCRSEWLRAEAAGFAPGAPEFCVFAMEVEPYRPGARLETCQEPGRAVAGGGKGRPRLGPTVVNVSGQEVRAYQSTTSLRHRQAGKPAYVDSAATPALVAPRSRADLLGAIAWVRWGERSTFAIVNDIGPRFGEGSIALHRLLRKGSLGEPQPVGPIPGALRCSDVERRVSPPFEIKPDLPGDLCRGSAKARGDADIRAYAAIGGGVETLVLPVKAPMSGRRLVVEEITVERLRAWAEAAGYTPERIAGMARCGAVAPRP